MKGKSENRRINDKEHLPLNKRSDFKRAPLQARSDRSLIQNPAPQVPRSQHLRARAAVRGHLCSARGCGAKTRRPVSQELSSGGGPREPRRTVSAGPR